MPYGLVTVTTRLPAGKRTTKIACRRSMSCLAGPVQKSVRDRLSRRACCAGTLVDGPAVRCCGLPSSTTGHRSADARQHSDSGLVGSLSVTTIWMRSFPTTAPDSITPQGGGASENRITSSSKLFVPSRSSICHRML
jgi:hypothetical protein